MNGGLVTQADPNDVAGSACTVLENAEFQKAGVIAKQSLLSTQYASGEDLIELFRWFNDDIGGDYWWVMIADDKNVKYSTNLTSWADLEVGSGGGERPRISAYGNELRFSNGRTLDPYILLYINRTLFWSTETLPSPLPGFYDDIARPRDVLDSITTFESLIKSEESDLGKFFVNPVDDLYELGANYFYANTHNITSNTYYYKYSLVFDGNQECALSEVNIGDTGGFTGTTSIPRFTFKISPGATLGSWNPRVTDLNIYRASTSISNPYYKVGTVPFKSDGANVISKTDARKGVAFTYIHGVEADHNGKTLICNGLRKTLGTHIGGGVHNMSTNWGTDTLQTGNTGATRTDRAWNDSCVIADTNLFTFQDNGLINSSNFESGWKVPAGEALNGGYVYADYTTEKQLGSYAIRTAWFEEGSAGSSTALLSPPMTVTAGDTYYYECWVRVASGSTSTDTVEMFETYVNYANDTDPGTWTGTKIASSSSVYSSNYATRNGEHTRNGNKVFGWEKLSGTFTMPSGENRVKLAFLVKKWNHHYIIDNIFLGKILAKGKAYGGKDVIMSPTLDIGTDTHKGCTYNVGASSGLKTNERGFTVSSTRRAILVFNSDTWNGASHSGRVFPLNELTSTNSIKLQIGTNYEMYKDGDDQIIDWYDIGLTDGTEHPTGSTSLETKYRHSKFINGRNYVANVKITNEQGSEIHQNWVMFSELNQPDVIPVVNYIQLQDAQGGVIVGLENLLGDLVVFMERGIYRISIPSTDPTAWSLSEAEENTGCISTDSITRYEAGVFFAGKDHLYYLDANFQAQPITRTIKDEYQSFTASTVTTTYDPKRRRLLLTKGSGATTGYELDLSEFPKERWSKLSFAAVAKYDVLALDENLELYAFEDATNLIHTTYVPDSGTTSTETLAFKRTTGWIGEDIESSKVLRRFNLKYNSGDAITAKFYIDGDSSTVVKTITVPVDTSGADWFKSKPGIRGRSFMIELSTAASRNTVEIRDMELEIG